MGSVGRAARAGAAARKLAELPTAEYELELAGQPDDFRLSADKVTLAKGQKQTVSIQEVPPAKPPYEITELRRFEGHMADIESVAFSPDGRRILSGSKDRTVRLWNVETGPADSGNRTAEPGVGECRLPIPGLTASPRISHRQIGRTLIHADLR